jgi:hypothetical protein
MLSQDRSETAAAEDDYVERSRVVLREAVGLCGALVRALDRLIQPVTDVAAENVFSEIGDLRARSRYGPNLASSGDFYCSPQLLPGLLTP